MPVLSGSFGNVTARFDNFQINTKRKMKPLTLDENGERILDPFKVVEVPGWTKPFRRL